MDRHGSTHWNVEIKRMSEHEEIVKESDLRFRAMRLCQLHTRSLS